MPVRMRMRWTAYAGVSTALATGVILKALAQRPNFYSAAVYLSQSSANLMILTNLLFVIACTFLLGLQKLLYGNLRPIEIEQLYEKAWFAVTETCLAMTVFRGEIGLSFLAMFFSLLTGKVWGWIGEGRVEVLEQQPPRNPRLFHTRLALSLGLSVAFDLTMLEYVVKQVMRMARPDMMVMFGFEFAVLSVMSISTAMRYAIDLVEIGIVRGQKRLRIEEIKRERMQAAVAEFQESQGGQAAGAPTSEASRDTPTPTQRTLDQVSQEAFNQPVDENEVEVEGWEDKGRYMFYLNLATDFFKLVIYLAFFFILLVFYGLPIHILRDVFLTMRSFLKRISDFIKYRTATRDMNARYPDATAEDIGREDVCIICREEMHPYQPAVVQPGQPQPRPNPVAERMRPKKLPCGHVLHFSCLRSWLERQQICPTCRANVVRTGGTGGANDGGQGEGGQGNGGQHPPGARPGPRVYHFGPLRIGVGAARGNNMFEELQQQLGDGAAPAPEGQPANPDPNAPRQIGVGLRWSGRRRRRADQNLTTQQQIDALAARIRQDTDELARSSVELGVLRSMQAELERLRTLRPGERQAQTDATTQNPAEAARPALPTYHPVSTLVPDQQQNMLQAGSDRLPAGLTLPEGWTMMPLRPVHLFQQNQHRDHNPDPLTNIGHPWPQPQGMPAPFGMLSPLQQFAQLQRRPTPTATSSGQTGSTEANGVLSPAPAPGQQPSAPSGSEPIDDLRTPAPSRGPFQPPENFHQHRNPWNLASMRNQVNQPRASNSSDPMAGGANGTMSHAAPTDASGASTAAAANTNQDVGQAANSLPSWGSMSSEPTNNVVSDNNGSAGASAPRVNGSHDHAAENGEANGSPPATSQPKDRHATVEDAVGDLDRD
ncbi:uncharacterized protein Z520_05254 [Fonsecaea multimorphosa CBS 102226]|uniref:RING-type E3 ubiquitin transferase n=1 Tax=Fonsecaea multimorphosa CBS 102226 TaxID=1442371 RepID=A0A0D2KPY7_9EURO|nr:uncharacterized protein Z520_05254 [Fonsecaea multimorphosa CBS 102226]KIX98793.1 hypothetical protein Z520_05254 [Fonsecaea multimorphosa CBS 102226]OAL25074.1 hypothetical protein AYO22_04951 [Fonsecaea multimorphosa]